MKALLLKELQENLKTGRFWILLIIFSFFAIMSPLTARYMPEIFASMSKQQGIEIKIPDPTWLDAISQYVKNISQLCTFVVILIYVGIVVKEKENGTAVFLLVKPVKRSSFIISKFIIAMMILFLIFTVSFSLSGFYTYLFFDSLPLIKFTVVNLLLLLNTVVVLSITIMFSAISKTQVVAAIFSFIAWLFLGLMVQFGDFGKFSPSSLISETLNIVKSEVVSIKPFIGAAFVIVLSGIISIFALKNWEA